MNAHFFNAETQRRRGWLTQAEVFDKVSIFAEIRFAAEDINDDFTHAGRNLFAGPTGWRSVSKIGFVRHHPPGQITDGFQVRRKFFAERLGQPQGDAGGSDGNTNKNPDCHRLQEVAGGNGCEQAGKQRANQQQHIQPTRADKLRWFFDSQFHRDLLQQCAPFLFWYQGCQGDGRCNIPSFPFAMPQKRFSQKIERTLRKAGVGSGTRHFALNAINQLSRREKFFRLGIFDADVKSIFDGHYDFDGVQSHVASFDRDGDEGQGGLS